MQSTPQNASAAPSPEQPIGESLPDWTPPPRPTRDPMDGRYCQLVPLDPAQHATALFEAFAQDAAGSDWTYLPYGPFPSLASFREWMQSSCCGEDPLFFTILNKPGLEPLGMASYLRIAPQSGSIEVGHIHFSPRLQQRPAATEAMFLMMQRAFELGYRRYEWKCDALNAPSRAAAARLGLSFEGIFRQASVYKQRNRDTAWFAAIDKEWPALREAFQRWLEPRNFDGKGRQRLRLSELTKPILQRPLFG